MMTARRHSPLHNNKPELIDYFVSPLGSANQSALPEWNSNEAESAWRAVRFNREYGAKYGAMIGKGICPQKAISIIAKKLLLSIRAVWLQNREYQVLLPKTR